MSAIISIRNTDEGHQEALVRDNYYVTCYDSKDECVWSGDVWDLFKTVVEAEGFFLVYKQEDKTPNYMVVTIDDPIMKCSVYHDNELACVLETNLKKQDDSYYTIEQGLLGFIRNGLLRNITVTYEDGSDMKPSPCRVLSVS